MNSAAASLLNSNLNTLLGVSAKPKASSIKLYRPRNPRRNWAFRNVRDRGTLTIPGTRFDEKIGGNVLPVKAVKVGSSDYRIPGFEPADLPAIKDHCRSRGIKALVMGSVRIPL